MKNTADALRAVGLAAVTNPVLLLVHIGIDKSADSVQQIAAYTMIVTLLVPVAMPWNRPKSIYAAAAWSPCWSSISSVCRKAAPIYAASSPKRYCQTYVMADMRTRLAADPFARMTNG